MAQLQPERKKAKAMIEAHLAALQEPKRTDLQALHRLLTGKLAEKELWFSDGRNAEGRVVTNPTIGYGSFLMKYAGGKTAEWFRIGTCVTSSGISVYILGLADKTHLSTAYGKRLGKAKVTGYCISFKTLKDIDQNVLEEAIRFGLAQKD